VDQSILERVLGVLGDAASIAQVTAALRVLAQVGDAREDLRAGLLTAGQFDRVTTLFGRDAVDRVVIERAFAIESRLRKLEHLGSGSAPLPPSRLRVASLDRRAGALGNRVLGTYLTVTLTHLLRQAPAGRRWEQTLCVLGAERLGADVLDRLTDACEVSRTGLVVGYRTIPGQVKERLGRGNAAVAFMRLGNADDARVASEQIGAEHRFVVSQLTDTVGTSVTDTTGDSYTSTVGDSGSVSDSASRARTRSRRSGRPPDHAARSPAGPAPRPTRGRSPRASARAPRGASAPRRRSPTARRRPAPRSARVSSWSSRTSCSSFRRAR
jgi:hypothetical protein